MSTEFIKRIAIIGALATALISGAQVVDAQKDDKDKDKTPPPPKAQTPPQQKTEPKPQRQEIYKQQQTQNQQRYEQRTQKYTQYQQQKTGQTPTVSQPRVQVRDQSVQQQNQPTYRTQRVEPREQQRVLDQQKQWHQSQQTWQTAYNSHWTNQQKLFDERSRQLEQQNRRQHLAFEQAYWERVREDQQRLQSWQFYNDVDLNYFYIRNGQNYYTSESGMELIRDAVNDGYQEGILAGQSDREDGWKSDYQDALAYEDASYGYNGYWVDLSEYQYYFREGFRRGYEDGYSDRYQYGQYENGNYVLLDANLRGIVDFSIVAQ